MVRKYNKVRKSRMSKKAPKRGRKMRTTKRRGMKQRNLSRGVAGALIGGGVAHLAGKNVAAGAAVGGGVGLLL